MPRTLKKSAKKRRNETKIRIGILRLNDSEKDKKEDDRLRHRKLREDSVFRAQENSRNLTTKRSMRKNPDTRRGEQETNSLKRLSRRMDVEVRRKEQEDDTSKRRISRMDVEVRGKEQEVNTSKRRISRMDSEVRRNEQEADTSRRSTARMDCEIRRAEKRGNASGRRTSRSDPFIRVREQVHDTERKRFRRSMVLFKSPPKKTSTIEDPSTKRSKEDTNENDYSDVTDAVMVGETQYSSPNTSIPEIILNEIHETVSAVMYEEVQNLSFQLTVTANEEEEENLPIGNPIPSSSQTTLRQIDKDYDNRYKDFFKAVREAPSHVCSCCGGLFYKNAISVCTEEVLKRKGICEELLTKIICIRSTTLQFCITCKRTAFKKKVPRLCLSNGFDFPPIPEVLKGLSPLESRLLALRLPFMQIRLLGAERQSILKGNIVNVENDLEVCTSVIPRTFDNSSTVQVKLMRRLTDKTPYMYETIRPAKVYAAAKYLLHTDGYKEEEVTLNSIWENSTEDETVDFLCHPNNNPTSNDGTNVANEETVADNQDSHRDPLTNITLELSDFMRAEECLLMPHGTNLGFKIAPGQNKYPVPLFADPKAEELSFPEIYCGVIRKFDPSLKVTYTDIAKSEIRRYDRRACGPTKLLYSFKKSYMEKLRSAVQIHMRKRVNKTRLKVKDVRTKEKVQQLIRNDDSYKSIWSNLRSSPAYWAKKQKTAMAMIRQFGKCHMFITLSAAESKWNELLVILSSLVNGKDLTEEEASTLSKEEKRQLIRSDPVTCMRHFDYKLRLLLNKLVIPNNGVFSPFGVFDYFTRLEFQMRGSPHSHGLYWIKGAPEYQEGDSMSEKAVVEFIDQFITCQRPADPTFLEKFKYQVHKHSPTCYKKCKSGKACRFGFPKPPLPDTRIFIPLPNTFSRKCRNDALLLYKKIQADLAARGRNPNENPTFSQYLSFLNTNEEDYTIALRSSIERTAVFLKRQVNEAFVNPYNKKILEAWGANMDIQFVLDTYACAKYCVGYILKSDGGMSNLMKATALSIKNGNYTLQQQIQKYAGIFANSSEVSAQEAAAFLLGIPNIRCSRSEVFINTAPPDDRTSILKPQQELEALDDDCEDISVQGLLDHYAKRPVTLEDKCLAHVAAFYQYSKSNNSREKGDLEVANDETLEFQQLDDENEDVFSEKTLQLNDGSGYLHKRRKAKVIRFVHYGKQLDPYNYWREQLVLFVPWRDEGEFHGDSLQIAHSHLEEIMENSKPFYHIRDIDENVLGDLLEEQRLTEEQADGSDDHENIFEEDEQYLAANLLEVPDSSRRIEHFLPPKQVPDAEFYALMRSLNEEQRKFVHNVLHLVKTSVEPFYHFLSGGAGVGKSHAIKAIVQSVLRYHGNQPDKDPNKIAVLVAAPTGMAAFNVGGMTIHGAFRLPPTQNNEPVSSLNDSIRNSLFAMLEDVQLVIIDEVSMMLVKQLFNVNLRLQQIMDRPDDFGNKSVLVVGHLRQLRPIGGRRIFEDMNTRQFTGNHLWPKFRLFEFTEIIRQRGEVDFCRALNNMSEGQMDEADVVLLRSCEISKSRQPPDDAIWLFKTNAQCHEYNLQYFEKLHGDGAVSIAIDTLEGRGTEFQRDRLLRDAQLLTHMQSDGLPFSTFLKVGAKYFISTNIKVSDGLFNGSHGILMALEKNQEDHVVIAWMNFSDPNTGRAMRKDMARIYCSRSHIDRSWTPIRRMKRKLSFKRTDHSLRIVRRQIPLVACNGMTIAKCQGSSLPAVVLNVEHSRQVEKLRTEELYVGCSRAMSKNGLFIKGKFIPSPPYKPDHPVTVEMERLRTLGFPFKLRFLQDEDSKDTKVYFHNVQSYNMHKGDILADQCPMSADILCFVEPHTLPEDDISIPGYIEAYRKDAAGNRHDSSGKLVFIKYEFAVDNNIDTTGLVTSMDAPGVDICTFQVLDCTYVLIYRSPTSSMQYFFQALEGVLAMVKGRFLVLGDLNIDLSVDKFGCAAGRLLQIFQEHNAVSLTNVKDYSTDGKSHIDVAFSNCDKIESWYYETYFSYHKPICSIVSKNV